MGSITLKDSFLDLTNQLNKNVFWKTSSLWTSCFLASYNSDDNKIVDANQKAGQLIKAYQFGFALNNYSKVECDTTIFLIRDSTGIPETYISQNSPDGIIAQSSIAYTSIIKLTGLNSPCMDQRSDPPSQVNLKHVEILYWRLK